MNNTYRAIIFGGNNSTGTEVIANPELEGTEDNLTGLQVDDTKYKVSKVTANPTLAGTESSLTGIEVDGTKYKVEAGGGASLYQHNIQITHTSRKITAFLSVITSSQTAFTFSTFANYLKEKGIVMGVDSQIFNNNHILSATGFCDVNGFQPVIGITGLATADDILAIPSTGTFSAHTNYITSGGYFFDNVVQC